MNLYESIRNNLNESEDDERFVEVDHKSVTDYDGFTTEYTWYKDKVNNTNVFVFGDRDVYKPTDGDYDWQEENDEAAKEWFDSYEGFNESEENRFYAQNKLNKLFNKLEDIDFAYIDKGNAEFDAIMKEIEAFVKENDITEKEFNDVIQYYKNGFDFSGYNFKDWFKKEEKVEEHREIRTPRSTPYDRTRAAVYATGNKWAIENFNATHN